MATDEPVYDQYRTARGRRWAQHQCGSRGRRRRDRAAKCQKFAEVITTKNATDHAERRRSISAEELIADSTALTASLRQSLVGGEDRSLRMRRRQRCVCDGHSGHASLIRKEPHNAPETTAQPTNVPGPRSPFFPAHFPRWTESEDAQQVRTRSISDVPPMHLRVRPLRSSIDPLHFRHMNANNTCAASSAVPGPTRMHDRPSGSSSVAAAAAADEQSED